MVGSLDVAQKRSATYQKDLEEKLAMIEVQRAAIRELSTPIIEVWDGILCLPVVGVLDSTRSAEMTEALLVAIVEKQARSAIIDITGIQVMDTATADHFLRMARAVRLLGANCVLTGINAGIAQTIVHMGVDLSGVVTLRSLRDALQHFIGSAMADR
jgi:rsbT co-antagonist protein RsbR